MTSPSTLSEDLLALLRCPESGQPLAIADDASSLLTPDGKNRYPLVGGLPWLLPNPGNSILDWGGKLHHFSQVLAHEIKALEQEIQCANIRTTTVQSPATVAGG